MPAHVMFIVSDLLCCGEVMTEQMCICQHSTAGHADTQIHSCAATIPCDHHLAKLDETRRKKAQQSTNYANNQLTSQLAYNQHPEQSSLYSLPSG
jgi:hypothetical protein